MGIVGVEQLQRWSLLDAAELTDQELICGLAELVQAQNVLAAMKARMLAQVERRELVEQFGATSTGTWLSDSGRIDPGPAKRQVNTALALETLPLTAQQFRLGEISAAHTEAVAQAIAVIDTACPHLPGAGRVEAEKTLVEVALADTPAKVWEKGRELLLALKPDTDDNAAEDTDRNRLEMALGRNGRGIIRGDVDALTYDKLQTALSPLCKPTLGPDGVPDTRCAAQRRADGFADILDSYLGSGLGPGEGGTKPHLMLLAGVKDLAGRGRFVHDLDDPDPHGDPPTAADYESLFDAEWPFHLSWAGSVSRQVARMLACDGGTSLHEVLGGRGDRGGDRRPQDAPWMWAAPNGW